MTPHYSEAHKLALHDEKESFGKYMEDFVEGDRFRHWPGKTITEADNHLFSLLTMNHHPLHLDDEHNRGGAYGRPLVVGTLVFSVVVGMTVRALSGKAIANLEYESVKHEAPTFYGDTLYAESEVLGVRPSHNKPDRGVVYVETAARNQRGERVLIFRRRFLAPRRPINNS